jgi:hypothetical protein
MKLKPLVAAVVFALSTTAAWAADSVEAADDATPAQTVGAAPSSSIENVGEDQIGWQYLDGQMRAAASDTASGSDQSANEASSSGDDQAASSEGLSDSDLSATSEDASDSDQSAAVDEEDGNDQVAEDSAGDDLMAMASPQTRSGTFKPATLEDFKAATQDKLVVILPSGWHGSVAELIAVLEGKSDAAEILVLSQDDPDNSDSEQE